MTVRNESEPFSLGAFTLRQCALATVLGLLVQGGLIAALLASGAADRSPLPPPPLGLAVRVTPLPDVPLPKKGTPKKRRLPSINKPPEPEPRPAAPPEPEPDKPIVPSAQAKNEKAATSKPKSRKRPRRQTAADSRPKPKLQMPRAPSEGEEDGFAEGTTSDPLKARAVDVYAYRLMAWFNRGFTIESGAIQCDRLKKLRARVSVQIGPDRRVLRYQVTERSGNSHFDERVRLRMQAAVSAQVPPPPPNYPDLLTSTVLTVFSGEKQCD